VSGGGPRLGVFGLHQFFLFGRPVGGGEDQKVFGAAFFVHYGF